MNIDKFKKYSHSYNEDTKRTLFSVYEINKDNYIFGFIMNKLDNEFETYMYVKSNKEIVSSLLLKVYADISLAREYYESLIKIFEENDIDYLLKLCEDENRTETGQNWAGNRYLHPNFGWYNIVKWNNYENL